MMSTVTPLVTEPPAAARAGADLRAARERLGLSLDDVVLTLRIRTPYILALEEGRISLLPGNAYAIAFVRTYATALGLDAEEMVRRFRTESSEFGQQTELVFPVPMPERGLPAGAVLLLGLVLVIGAYVGWYRLSGDGRLPAETVTAIPERLAPLAEQALPPVVVAATPVPAPAPTTLASVNAEPPVVGPGVGTDPAALQTQANPAPPVMAVSPASAAAAQVPIRPSDGSAAAAVISAPGSVIATGAAPPETGRVMLRASADAWVQVKDRSGGILLNRTMKAGETWSVPPRPDLLLTAGNAGGTDILVDGAVTPSIGPSGAVRRDLPLDPDQIKDGKLASAAAPLPASGRSRQ